MVFRREDNDGDGFTAVQLHSTSLLCLAALAVLYTMYFAATLLIPVVAALLLYMLLTPVLRRLLALGLPRTIAALLLILMLVVTAGAAIHQLSEPGAAWLRDAPTSLAEFRAKIRERPNPLAEVRNASEAVEEAVAEITGSGDESGDDARAVAIREPGALETVLTRLPMIAASSIVTLVMTLFLLIFGDRLLRRVVALGKSFAARRRIVMTVRHVQRDIAYYLGTITLINLGLGCVVTAAMAMLGLPNPVLWGVLAAILNFAPYVGAMITAATLLLVGFSTFDTYSAMLAPALVFLVITTLEGQIVTPMLLGHRLELNPLFVFLSVLVVGWLWGLVGALIAVPLVASVRIVLSNVPRLRPVAELMVR